MGRLFGTDGIRGIANRDLSIRRAEEVGMALAEVIRGEHPEKRPTVVIGRDTRLSGEMLQAALAGGLMAGGADVVLLGVVPTPAVAYLTVQKKAAAGVVITASHNPKEYNGYNAKELAQKYELSVNWVLNICKDNPLPEQQSLF